MDGWVVNEEWMKGQMDGWLDPWRANGRWTVDEWMMDAWINGWLDS